MKGMSDVRRSRELRALVLYFESDSSDVVGPVDSCARSLDSVGQSGFERGGGMFSHGSAIHIALEKNVVTPAAGGLGLRIAFEHCLYGNETERSL